MEKEKNIQVIDFKDAIASNLDEIISEVQESQDPAEAANEVIDDNAFDMNNAIATGSFVNVSNATSVSKEEAEAYSNAMLKLEREQKKDEVIRSIVAQKEAEWFDAHHYALSGQQRRKLKKQVTRAFESGKIRFNKPKSLNK